MAAHPTHEMHETHAVASWPSHWAFEGYGPWLSSLAEAQVRAPDTWQGVLGTAIAFVSQHRPLPAGLDSVDVDGSYADCCVRGAVPSRRDNLHDLLNALVWARFPLAKRALCERQVGLARARAPSSGQRLRTREQDAAAMLDEGGMLLGPTTRAVFGHAALEDAVVGRPLRPFLLQLPSDDLDVALAALLADPRPLPRIRGRTTLLPA